MLVGLSPEYVQWMLAAWAALAFYVLAVLFLRPWRERRGLVRTGFKISLSLWLLAFAAVLAETLFVSLYSTTDAFGLSLVSQRWNERFVQRNNWECRDRKRYEGDIPPGRKRLAIVGDSFAFGHGVRRIEDRFGDLLERRLNAETSDRWEVYNLAEPGADTGWESRTLHALGREYKFRADVVLLSYVLNDLEDLVPENKYIVGTIILDNPQNFFCRRFYLPNFLYYRMTQFRRPEFRNYFSWLKDAYSGDIWARQRKRLDSVKRWCDEHHAKLAVVVFPFLNNFRKDYIFEEAHGVLKNYFAETKTPELDLLPVYRRVEGQSLVVGSFDAHPNETAHRIAAEEIWTHLLKDLVK